jgi:phytoene synthase
MDQRFEVCATRVRESDKDRFLATLFAPERHRGPLFVLYAFDAEISEVRDRITSPMPGEVRLQWWRDVLTETERGYAAANPIALGLREVVRQYALPVPVLLDLIDAHAFDLYNQPMPTLGALQAYAAATSATVIRLATSVLNDGAEPGDEEAFRHAGMVSTLTWLLRRLGVHSSRGQRYLPNDVLARHGAQPAELRAGQVSDKLRFVLAGLRALAGSHLAALKNEGTGVPEQMVPAFLPVSLAPLTLAAMERANTNPFRPPLVLPWQRQWALWRAARRPERFLNVRQDDPVESGGRR